MKAFTIVLVVLLASLLAVPELHAARATDIIDIDFRQQVGDFFRMKPPVPRMLAGATP